MFTKLPNLFFISFLILFFFSCSKDDVEENTAEVCQTLETGTTIMPLGASRVQGFPPFFESYRYEFWKDLVDCNWTFDLIGEESDPITYPTYQNMTFDPDQFGGAKGKKFMVKKMREYVLSISHLPMKEQHKKIKEVFSNWKGDFEQVDDVCVIGIKI